MADLKTFELRRNEAFEKLMEIIYEAQDKADYIGMDEAKQEMARRYMWLAEQGWPQFFTKEPKLCPKCSEGMHYINSIGQMMNCVCKGCGLQMSYIIKAEVA